jgi:hypothetical protein
MGFFRKIFSRKKSRRIPPSLDTLNTAFAAQVAKIEMERLTSYLKMQDACRAGFYCIKCHAPFEDIGIAFVCDCPPGEIVSPIHYMEDLDPDIRKILNDQFMDLLDR